MRGREVLEASSAHELLLLSGLTECRQRLVATEHSLRTARALIDTLEASVAAKESELAHAQLIRHGELMTLRAEWGWRVEAHRTILGALLASTRWRFFGRRRFKKFVGAYSRSIPDEGPIAVEHEVLMRETQRVLGYPRNPQP